MTEKQPSLWTLSKHSRHDGTATWQDKAHQPRPETSAPEYDPKHTWSYVYQDKKKEQLLWLVMLQITAFLIHKHIDSCPYTVTLMCYSNSEILLWNISASFAYTVFTVCSWVNWLGHSHVQQRRILWGLQTLHMHSQHLTHPDIQLQQPRIEEKAHPVKYESGQPMGLLLKWLRGARTELSLTTSQSLSTSKNMPYSPVLNK